MIAKHTTTPWTLAVLAVIVACLNVTYPLRADTPWGGVQSIGDGTEQFDGEFELDATLTLTPGDGSTGSRHVLGVAPGSGGLTGTLTDDYFPIAASGGTLVDSLYFNDATWGMRRNSVVGSAWAAHGTSGAYGSLGIAASGNGAVRTTDASAWYATLDGASIAVSNAGHTEFVDIVPGGLNIEGGAGAGHAYMYVTGDGVAAQVYATSDTSALIRAYNSAGDDASVALNAVSGTAGVTWGANVGTAPQFISWFTDAANINSYNLLHSINTPAVGSLLQVASTDGSSPPTLRLQWATGAPPTGSASGVLSGSYPNPGLAAGAVANSNLAARTAASRIMGAGSGGTDVIDLLAERGLSIDSDGLGIASAGVTTDLLEAKIMISMARINDFRLTGVSDTPVMTSDSTSLSTIYLAPHTGNTIALYDGTNWNLYQPASERSLAVTGRTTDLPFDIFVYDASGTVTLEFTNWTNATTRATALVRQDGVWVRSGATTRRYLGTCRPRGTTTFHWRVATADASARIDLWNVDNRVPIPFFVKDGTNTWTYTTATWRQARASTNNQVEVVVGLQESSINLNLQVTSSNSTANIGRAVAFGYDSTTTPTGVYQATTNTANYITGHGASHTHQPAIGRHYYVWLEYSTATGTCTWYGDNGSNVMQSGFVGTFDA